MLEWKENAYGDKYLPAYNDAFSRLPADAVFKQYLQGFLADPHVLYIVIGTDSGLLPAYVEANFSDTGSKYLFIELPEVLNAIDQLSSDRLLTIKQHKLVTDAKVSMELPTVQIVDSSMELDQLAELGGYSDFIVRTQYRIVKSLAVVEKPTPEYEALFEKFQQQFLDLEVHSHVGAARHYMDPWFKDAFELLVPVQRLKNFYKGKTFVLLGGAPSLPLIFDWLKAHREDVIVMAAIRIAGRLHKEGITPDYFVGVDGKPQMLDYCRELFQFHDKSVLITSHHLAPNVLSQWSGPIVYMNKRFPFGDKLADEAINADAVGPTVMNAALHIAGYMGADTIYLSGVDMCYSPQGESHESSSIESQIGRYIRYGGHLVSTYADIDVETNVHMLSASQAMGKQVHFMKLIKPSLSVINVNPYATRIPNIVHRPISDLPDVANKIDVGQRQQARQLASLTNPEIQELYSQVLLPSIRLFRKKLIQAVKYASQGLLFIDDCHIPDSINHKQLNKIIKARTRLESVLGEDLFLLFEYGFVDYVAILAPLEKQKPEGDELLKVLSQYFSAISKSAKGLSNVLDGMLLRAKWRIQECECKLTEGLVDYWLAENQPGRCHVWFERCQQPQLTHKEQVLFDRCAAAFIDLLQNKVPSFKGGMMSKEKQLASLWKFTTNAISAKDIDRVSDLASYVAELEGEEFEQLAYYLSAHEQSMRENWQASEEAIDRVTHPRLVFSALQLRLTNAMRKGDIEATLQSVEALSDYDDYYLYILAILAQNIGLSELAGNAFIYYLQRRPNDVAALWDYWHYLKALNNHQSMQDFQQFIEIHEVNDGALMHEVLQALSS